MKFSTTDSAGKSLVALTALAFSTLIAAAAPVPSWVDGDIFLGFRAAAGDGADESYLVKLGNVATSFNSSGVLSLGNLGADLSHSEHYGAGWNTRADLYWGIFGVTDPSGTPVLYASRQRTSVSAPASAWPSLSLTARPATATAVNSVVQSATGTPGGYITLTATANSPVAGFQSYGAQASSYKYQVTSGGSDFGSLSKWTSIEGSFGGGAAATVLDVFKIEQSGVSLFGTFSISSSGDVTFTKPSVAPVDHDGDGFFDFEEALAGTSDNNAADFFKVQSVTPGPSGTSVSFNSIASRSYKIYYSEDLASWQLIDTVTAGPYSDTNPLRTARTKGFYKVAVTNP